MTNPSHATITRFRLDPAKSVEQRQILHEFVVPSVRQAPGLITGYWTAVSATGESLAFMTFESAESAAEFVEGVRGNTEQQLAHGVELIDVHVVEVEASTSSG